MPVYLMLFSHVENKASASRQSDKNGAVHMALYIDSAYLDDITNVVQTLDIAGITTNPTILLAARERGQTLPLPELIEQLLRVSRGDVFVQPGTTDEQEMEQQVREYIHVGRRLDTSKQRVIPKLPMTEMGVRVAKRLNYPKMLP